MNVSDLLAVQKLVEAGRFRENVQAADWIGHPVAKVLGLDTTRKDHRRRVTTLVKTWIANGALVLVEGENAKRQPKMFIEVGAWAIE